MTALGFSDQAAKLCTILLVSTPVCAGRAIGGDGHVRGWPVVKFDVLPGKFIVMANKRRHRVSVVLFSNTRSLSVRTVVVAVAPRHKPARRAASVALVRAAM